MAAKTPPGYGRYLDKLYSHRFAYEQLVGPIPTGMTIDHLCKVTSCCNPEHLEVVTKGENSRRAGGCAKATRLQLAKTHCAKGHEYTPENTGVNSKGTRQCKICRKAIQSKFNAMPRHKA